MGEEEATMREKLIEAMAEAIYNSHGFQKPWADPDTIRRWKPSCIRAATAAFDAALARMKEPSEEMLTAGAESGAEFHESYQDDQTEFEQRQAARCFTAMLATLRSH